MKFFLIAAVAVLALAQGSMAAESITLENIGQLFEDAKTKLTQELTTLIQTHDLGNQAQTFLEDKKAQLEPLTAKLQEQMSAAATTIEEQIKPLAANVQTQIQPMIDNFQQQMEEILRKLTEEARAIGQ